MPRSRGGAGPARSAPPRPQAMPPRPAAPAQQQQRQMSTAQAARPGAPPAQAQQSQSPGLFGQMASTAAGVAVGSSIGHAIGGFFGGGSSAAPAEQQEYQQPVDNYSQPGQMYNTSGNQAYAEQGPCGVDIKNFTTCMNQNQGDLNVCGWYLDQLKACQAAASKY